MFIAVHFLILIEPIKDALLSIVYRNILELFETLSYHWMTIYYCLTYGTAFLFTLMMFFTILEKLFDVKNSHDRSATISSFKQPKSGALGTVHNYCEIGEIHYFTIYGRGIERSIRYVLFKPTEF